MPRLWEVILMHLTMRSMNNEEAYWSWCSIMPDEPTLDDFEYFAYDDEKFEELKEGFQKILDVYVNDGIYNPNKDVEKYVLGLYPDAPIIKHLMTFKTFEQIIKDTNPNN